MFRFGRDRTKNTSALVPKEAEWENSQLHVSETPLQPNGQKLDRDYSVLETVEGDGLVLIGKGTTVVGEIANCSKVEIQGHLEGSLIADSVVVREGVQ